MLEFVSASRHGGNDALDDLEALGAPAELIAQLRAEAETGGFRLAEDNAAAYSAFLYVHDQLKPAPMKGFVGLDMAAVDVVLTRLGITLSPPDFEKLMLLGRFYVAELNSG